MIDIDKYTINKHIATTTVEHRLLRLKSGISAYLIGLVDSELHKAGWTVGRCYWADGIYHCCISRVVKAGAK